MVTAYDPRLAAINVAANSTINLLPALASADMSAVTLAEWNAGTTVQCAIREFDLAGSVATGTEQFLCDAEEMETTGATKWTVAPLVIQTGDPQAANALLDALTPGTTRYIVRRLGIAHATAGAVGQKVTTIRVQVTLKETVSIAANANGQKYETRVHWAVKGVNQSALLAT